MEAMKERLRQYNIKRESDNADYVRDCHEDSNSLKSRSSTPITNESKERALNKDGICKYWLRGLCRRTDGRRAHRCRFKHGDKSPRESLRLEAGREREALTESNKMKMEVNNSKNNHIPKGAPKKDVICKYWLHGLCSRSGGRLASRCRFKHGDKSPSESPRPEARREASTENEKIKIEDNNNKNSNIPKPRCPTCFDEMSPNTRIAQCISGHLLCWGCKEKMGDNVCAFCDKPVNGRALGMEAYLRTIYLWDNTWNRSSTFVA